MNILAFLGQLGRAFVSWGLGGPGEQEVPVADIAAGCPQITVPVVSHTTITAATVSHTTIEMAPAYHTVITMKAGC
jgi:hypothetical protein